MTEPTFEQLAALMEFAKANGRTWKDKLSLCWSTGTYHRFPNGQEYAGTLQQIRNQFGPSWLVRFSLNKATQTDDFLKMRISVVCFPTGLSYADTHREVRGDYKRLAFLFFDTLELKIETDCPKYMADWIAADAAKLQSRPGEQYSTSGSGQSITLGYRIKPKP